MSWQIGNFVEMQLKFIHLQWHLGREKISMTREIIPCWPVLGNMCVILAVTGLPGVDLRGVTAEKKLPTGEANHWEQTAPEEPCCWHSGSELLVSTKRTAFHKTQWNTVSQTCHENILNFNLKLFCAPHPATGTDKALGYALRQLLPESRGHSRVLKIWTQVRWIQVARKGS